MLDPGELSWEQRKAVKTATQQKAVDIFVAAVPGAFAKLEDFKNFHHLTARYQDSQGRAAEVRLYQDQFEP